MLPFDENFQAAQQAFTSGNKQGAITLLADALQIDPRSEAAWFLLAECVEQPERKQYCYERILAINPANQQARKSLISQTALPASLEPASPSTIGRVSETNPTISSAGSVQPQAETSTERITRLLTNLKSPDKAARLRAVNALGDFPIRDQQVTRELTYVSEHDPAWDVAAAAARALTGSKPQGELQSRTTVAYGREVDRPGCVTFYVVIVLLSVCVTAFFLYNITTVFFIEDGVQRVGADYARALQGAASDGDVLPEFSDEAQNNLGWALLKTAAGVLIAVISWNLLMVFGLWKMKAWARWAHLIVSGLSILVAGLSLCWMLSFATISASLQRVAPYIASPTSPISSRNLTVTVVWFVMSIVFVVWLIGHKDWDPYWD